MSAFATVLRCLWLVTDSFDNQRPTRCSPLRPSTFANRDLRLVQYIEVIEDVSTRNSS